MADVIQAGDQEQWVGLMQIIQCPVCLVDIATNG